MMVRRYVVKDMPEAIELIRNDLGKDAVILSTKKITVSKWFGLWRARRIEVLASTGEQAPARLHGPGGVPGSLMQPRAHGEGAHGPAWSGSGQAGAPTAAAPAAPRGWSGPGTYRLWGGRERSQAETPALTESRSERARRGGPDMLDETGGRAESVPGGVRDAGGVAVAAPHAREVSARYATAASAGRTSGNAVGGAQPGEDVTAGSQPSVPTGGGGMEQMWREISEMKQMLATALHSQAGLLRNTVQSFLDQGMDEEHLLELLLDPAPTGAAAESASVQTSGLSIRELLAVRIRERLHDLREPQPIRPESRFVAFVGPTGVGKTTTIAKIAALHVLAGVRKVGLMTADTFRIAAVDQLRTYASILNVPLEVIYRPSDVPLAVERLADCDLVLIDTAGRNYRSESCIDELRSLLQAVPVDETYLVLSVTQKPQDLDELASAFCRLPVDKFLFTKIDETSTYGALFNLLMRYRKPVSYITTGQNVPDDIEVPTLDRLLELILGGAA
ncbi:MAG: flagellar biosynthesis protein FlhF [Alicyclobacillaceae bacterium]|nr:flagellar biosynthesis protein FlhF [Alicyclobacillaceae bacterium]